MAAAGRVARGECQAAWQGKFPPAMASWPLIDVDALAGMGQEAAALIAELARPGPFSPQPVAADAIDAVEALRARFQEQGLFCKWRKEAPSALLWALESLPEDLWARGVVCPAERAVMLGATSRRVRALLARMQRRVPAAVRIVSSVSLDAVAGGTGRLQGWCNLVRLHVGPLKKPTVIVSRGLRKRSSSAAVSAGRLAGVLGQCFALAELSIFANHIGAEGAGRLAGVLGQCSSLAVLHLYSKVLGQCSSLAVLNLCGNGIDNDGIAMLTACWPGDSGLEIDHW